MGTTDRDVGQIIPPGSEFQQTGGRFQTSFIRLWHQLLAGVSVRSAGLKGIRWFAGCRCQLGVRLTGYHSLTGHRGQRLVPTGMLSSPVGLSGGPHPEIANKCGSQLKSVRLCDSSDIFNVLILSCAVSDLKKVPSVLGATQMAFNGVTVQEETTCKRRAGKTSFM